VVARRVNIAGFDATMRALKEYDEVQYKLIQREITKAATAIVRVARAELMSADVLSNWGRWTFTRNGTDLSFEASRAASTIKVTRGSGKIKRNRGVFVTNAIGVASDDAATVIFHHVGHAKRPGARTSAKGESMRANMAQAVKKPRGIWAGEEQEKGNALRLIEQAVREAEKITNRTTA
jgi:hypothetical protein